MVLRIQSKLGGGKRVRLNDIKPMKRRAELATDERIGAIAAEVLSAVGRLEATASRPALALAPSSSSAKQPRKPKRRFDGHLPRPALRLVHSIPADPAREQAPGTAASGEAPVRAEPRYARRDASFPMEDHRLGKRLRRRIADLRQLARLQAASAQMRPSAGRQPGDGDRQETEVSTTGPPRGR